MLESGAAEPIAPRAGGVVSHYQSYAQTIPASRRDGAGIAHGRSYGEPTDASATVGKSAGDFVALLTFAGGVRSRLFGGWLLSTDLEVGHTLAGATFLANDDGVAGLSGVVLGARAGVSFDTLDSE